MSELNDLVETLLTVDGKGREAKRKALLELLCFNSNDASDAVNAFKPAVPIADEGE